MNGLLKVLFADDSNDFCEIINDFFTTYQDISIVSIAKNGLEAYEMIKQHEPDIVVLDMIMPYMDGIGVLDKLREQPPVKMPLIIILSAIGQEDIAKKAISLGASYYFVKPFSLDLLAERIRMLGRKHRSEAAYQSQCKAVVRKNNQVSINSMEGYVTRLIRELGIPAHIKGYQFLRDAILMANQDIDMISSISKLIYPDIAKRYNTTATRVESAIRHAIEVAWERGEGNAFKRIFGYDVAASLKRPSNTEFIATILDTMKLDRMSYVKAF